MEPWLRLDRASPEEAARLLRTCCGSSRWIERMLARRPFNRRDDLLAAARDEWFALSPADWHEAFDHHPRIGDREAIRRRFSTTRHLSEKEQAGVDAASEQQLNALEEGNRSYEQRFGYIFIVCATGRGAGEILALLDERLKNDPEVELRIAAGEQARITELRLLGIG